MSWFHSILQVPYSSSLVGTTHIPGVQVTMSSSDSDDEREPGNRKLFGCEKPIHALLGGGEVANVLLWRDKRVSATILIGVSVLWFLFEVAEYNLVTLLSHILITTMLVIFIWSTGADIFKWSPPTIPKIILDEAKFKEAASSYHTKLNNLLSKLIYIGSGNDPKHLFGAIITLWVISAIGNSISTLNLLFFGLLCLETLPFLYERYEEEVDYLAGRVNRQMRKMYRKFNSNVLEKIPKGPVNPKEKKVM